MIRLFVALGLPEALCDELSAMCGGIPGARWVPAENYHLTLRFIGEVPKYQAQEVDEALAAIRAPGFELTLRGVGTFGKDGRMATLWVGVEKTEPLLLPPGQGGDGAAAHRAGAGAQALRAACHPGADRRARRRTRLIAFVQAHNLFRAPPVPMEGFTLFSSRLGKERAVYDQEVEYGLLQPRPAAAPLRA